MASLNFSMLLAVMKLIATISLIILHFKFLGTVVHCYEIQAFKDFLQINNLRHGIIVVQGNQTIHRQHGLRSLLENFRIRFYNTDNLEQNFKKYFYFRSPRVGILVPKFEHTIPIQTRLLVEASRADTFNNSYAWFAIAEEYNKSFWNEKKIENILKDHSIKINSDFTLAVKIANNTSRSNIFLKLYDIYRICNPCDFPLEIEEKGNWTKERGMLWLPKYYGGFGARRRNLKNFLLPAATAVHDTPKDMTQMDYLLNDEINKQYDELPRKGYQIFNMVASMLNITYNITILDTWGLKVGDNWTGVVGVVVRREIELGISPMRFTLPRLLALQYTPVIHTEVMHFLLRHPRRNAIRNIFFEPLSNEVWWSILSLIVLATMLLAIHVRQEQKKHMHDIVSIRRKQKTTSLTAAQSNASIQSRFDFIVLSILEAFFMQGPAPDIFKLVSTRTLIMSTCIFSIMLMQFYSAFIVGSLLTPPTRTITNRAALYNSSFKLGMENISYNFDVLINTKDPIGREMYKRICLDPKNSIMTIEEGAERIKQGGFAFHVTLDRVYRILLGILTESEFCDLQEIPIDNPYPCGGIYSRDYEYRELFASTILKVREVSLMRHNDMQWEVQKIDCNLNMNKVVGVDLEHFLPALAFLALAALISGVVLILEILNKKAQKQNGSIRRYVRRLKMFDAMVEGP